MLYSVNGTNDQLINSRVRVMQGIVFYLNQLSIFPYLYLCNIYYFLNDRSITMD